MHQKAKFISDYLRQIASIAQLCEHYGISRKTGHKWISRYLTDGPPGLEARSRAPKHIPHRTDQRIIDALIELRQRHPSWGAKKLVATLHTRRPTWELPALSTVYERLGPTGLMARKVRRRVLGHPGKPQQIANAPNDIWCADFKGQFKLGNGQYCYALTVTDQYSRYLLECQGLPSTSYEGVIAVFRRLFRTYGLPKAIRTDNGVPFANNTLGRLSSLSAWWIQLNVLPDLIEPGKPQQNGRHERMHRTLKAETTRPPAYSPRPQQAKFNRFRIEFNEVRPHEALDMATPASVYQPSERLMPTRIDPFEYPDRFEPRFVSANGAIRWQGQWVNVSRTCVGQYVGLEEVDQGIWNVYFGPIKLGRFFERSMHIEDDSGRLKRQVNKSEHV